jgi:hypothetical protein
MSRDLQILVNTPDQLTVMNPPDSFNWFKGIVFGGLLVLALFLCWKLVKISRWLGLVLIVVVLIISMVISSNFKTSYRLAIDRKNNTLIYQTMGLGNDIVESQQLDLNSVKRADIDFDRARRRIVLTLKDNQQVFPLGMGFDYENSQFEVLDLIRQHIGQQPPELNR